MGLLLSTITILLYGWKFSLLTMPKATAQHRVSN